MNSGEHVSLRERRPSRRIAEPRPPRIRASSRAQADQTEQHQPRRTASVAGQKIRIRLKAYDHEAIDASARKIVETVTRTGASVGGPAPLPAEKKKYHAIPP